MSASPRRTICSRACDAARSAYRAMGGYEGDRQRFIDECNLRCEQPSAAPQPELRTSNGWNKLQLLTPDDEMQCDRAVYAAADAYYTVAGGRRGFRFGDWAESVCVGLDPLLRHQGAFAMVAARDALSAAVNTGVGRGD